MRILAFFEFAAVIVGVIAMVAGQFFVVPKGVHLGVFLIGAGIALGGLESVFTRRMSFRWSEDRYESYAGAPAMIVGLMALAVGTALIATAYLLTEGLWHTTVSQLARRPGPVLVAAGFLLIGTGVLMMLNPRGRVGVWWTLLVRFPRTVLGFLVAATGVAGIALGVLEAFEPQAFALVGRRLSDLFSGLAPGRGWGAWFGLRR